MIETPGKKQPTLQESFLVEKFFPFFAHEIRNPLQAMGGALTIIERRSDRKDPTLTQSIQIIKEEVQQLTQFVQECLEFTRPPDKTQWREMDVNEIIKAVLNILNFIHKGFSEKIKVKTVLDPRLVKVVANYEEIKKVLINIIRNSFESMAESRKKELIIKTAVQKNGKAPWVAVVIKDTGIGIKKGDLKHIGIPFFTTKIRGTGLGLALCRRIIIERHQGEFLIESEAGKGTAVTIKLPVKESG